MGSPFLHRRRTPAFMLALCALGLGPDAASADIVSFLGNSAASTSNLGLLSGSLEYVSITGTTGKVTITLTNTTPGSIGGYITGLVFNVPGSGSASLFSTTNANFLDTGSESAPPFGTFDAGAALGANWTGGGSPNGGIAVGQTATLVFNVTASNAASLTAADFLGSANSVEMVVRFRGLANGGSDKVPVIPDIPEVPAPATAALAGLGALALASRRRRT